MKKLITTVAIVLSMAMLIVSCSNPAGGTPETTPETKPSLPTPTVKPNDVVPEGTPSIKESKQITKIEDITSLLSNPSTAIENDLHGFVAGVSQDFISLDDTTNQFHQDFVDTFDGSKDTNTYTYTNKVYESGNISINLDKINGSITLNSTKDNSTGITTSTYGLNGIIEGTLTINASKYAPKDSNNTPSTKQENLLKNIKLNVKANFDNATLILTGSNDSVEGKMTGKASIEVAGAAYFDTGDKAGILNIGINAKVDNLTELYKEVSAVIEKLESLYQNEEKTVEVKMTKTAEILDANIKNLSFALKSNITDTTGKETLLIVDTTNFADIAKVANDFYSAIPNENK